MINLTVLADNNTIIDKYYMGEPAFSVYLEVDNKRILFDTGYSDVFLKNAQIAKIDLSKLDFIVLSHGHNDHTGGLRFLSDNDTHAKIVACENIFEQRYDDIDGEFGSFLSEDEVKKTFDIEYKNEPYWLSKNAVFLGPIPRLTDFEAKEPVGFFKKTNEPDFVKDDSALVLKTEKGLVVLTGCSHSGIVNICEYSKKICKIDKIHSIIGGLHLKEANPEQVEKTAEYIKKLNLASLYACHCTGFEAQCMLKDVFKETGAGLRLEF